MTVVGEGFADRAYRARRDTGAAVASRGRVLHDPDAVVARAVRMAVDGEVEAVGGEVVPCRVASICVHGDTPGAVDLAARVRTALIEAGLRLDPFTAA